MLKIEESKKIIEYKGEQYELASPSAKEQTAFAVEVEKEKDHIKQVDLMVNFVAGLGVSEPVAKCMSLKSLQSIVEYVSDSGKK
jgi:hypothetical protein